ncbi:MAG: polyamine aminopropyltransferase [Thermovirga sp.]|nr:polyamine aminopropyltransferase [Thermovirga sp.]
MEKRTADLWVTEYQTGNMRLGLRLKEILCNKQTPYQHLLVVDTFEYGKVMLLDGAIQITEKDEFTYHEMMAHVLMCSHPNPRRVLVVGGGDGGTVREIVKYPSLEKVFLVDIDEEVINASRKYFPSVSSGLDNEKVEIKPMDAIKFIKKMRDYFDVVIVDSTDPVDFAAGLFKSDFYMDVFNALRDNGMMIAQTESPFAEADIVKGAYDEMSKVFPIVKLCWGAMPTYPTGMWTYTVGSKGPDPSKPLRDVPVETRYYSRSIHEASFVLPRFVRELLSEEEGK